MKKSQRFRIYAAGLYALMTLGTATIFRACGHKDDGSWMRCHTAQQAVVVCAAILCLLMLASALIRQKNKAASAGLSFLAVPGSVLVFFIPGRIVTMCMMKSMRCYSVMQPFVRVMAVLAGLCALVSLVMDIFLLLND